MNKGTTKEVLPDFGRNVQLEKVISIEKNQVIMEKREFNLNPTEIQRVEPMKPADPTSSTGPISMQLNNDSELDFLHFKPPV